MPDEKILVRCLGMLRAMQFSSVLDVEFCNNGTCSFDVKGCPVCRVDAPRRGHGDRHYDGCELAALIEDLESAARVADEHAKERAESEKCLKEARQKVAKFIHGTCYPDKGTKEKSDA